MTQTINPDESARTATLWSHTRAYLDPPGDGRGEARPFSRGLDAAGYVIDASMVSQTWASRTNHAAQDWLAGNRVGDLYVPAIVLEVIEQGIRPERFAEPSHANELALWKSTLSDLGFKFILPQGEILPIVDAMMSTRSLKNLWWTSPNSKREKLPHEIFVAATSIALGMKLVTLGPTRYQEIVDAGFSLPGIVVPEPRSLQSVSVAATIH